MKLESYADMEFLVEKTFEDEIHGVEIEVKQPSRFPFELPSRAETKRAIIDGEAAMARKAELAIKKRVARGRGDPASLVGPDTSIGSSKAA